MKIATIIGPTAVGKTSLAISLAERIDGEIISADSRQIYRHMRIGTAQPDSSQRRLVRFHLIDFIEPSVSYSCGQFARDAEAAMSDIISREKIPIVCGGTGLYIRALYDPLHTLPESDPAIKRKLTQVMNDKGLEILHARLCGIDPVWAKKIGPRDRQRILRALEVYELTGTPISILTSATKHRPQYDPLYIGLHLPRTELYDQIDRRFDLMVEQNFLQEVRSLMEQEYDPECNALRTIGYQEMIDHLQGNISLSTAITKAKQHTRQFAKRQLTWFRKLNNVLWFDPRDKDLAVHIAAIAEAVFNE